MKREDRSFTAETEISAGRRKARQVEMPHCQSGRCRPRRLQSWKPLLLVTAAACQPCT